MPSTYLFQQFGKTFELAGQVARIDGYGDLRVQQFGVQQRTFRQLWQQPSRQVVDAVEAVVFEHVERCALTGTGAAADDDQAHGERRSRRWSRACLGWLGVGRGSKMVTTRT